MLKRNILVIGCAAVLASGSVAQAQESATIVLRSGERISGALVDLGGVGFTIDVNGNMRRVPRADVALIEFANAGNPNVSNETMTQLNSGKHVVVLRSGEQIAGNLFDIGGTSPLKITVDVAGGRRDINSSDISRIYLAPQGASATATSGTTATTASVPGAIAVPANQQWVASGITVRKGETLGVHAQGEVQLSGDMNDKAAPAGSLNGRRAPGSPLSNELAGALIARIGNGNPFAIGNLAQVQMPESGPLYLGVNDDSLGDNQGQFNVTIVRRAGGRRR
ncbi:MAG: hypothetical protein HYU53_16355 [Acidobacteria bacterium]|nr:hypothetical protein [Acidobacteriota bacterium]